MDARELLGGCACGQVRYRITGTPFDAGYCHCSMCRRAGAAPALPYATVPLRDFTLVAGEPRRRRSSSFGERWFCGDCGAQLAMRVDHQPDTIDFTLASLDQPERVRPGFHIFYADRVPWLDPQDGLPRYEGFRPGTRGL